MGVLGTSIMQAACCKLATCGSIPWFGLSHAKVFLALCNGKKQSPEEIAEHAGISRDEAFEALDALIANKALSYDGNKYFAEDPLQAINLLIDMAEAKEAKPTKQPIVQAQREKVAELLEEYA